MFGEQLRVENDKRKVRVKGCIMCPQNACIEVLTPKASQCDCVWRYGL